MSPGYYEDADRVEINDGRQIWDTMGNPIERGNTRFDVPQQFSPAELQVGRKWTAAFKGTEDGRANSVSFDLHIARRETVSVPAGKFETFRVDGRGGGRQWSSSGTQDVAGSGVDFLVKYEHLVRTHRGQLVKTERHELVSLRQHGDGPRNWAGREQR